LRTLGVRFGAYHIFIPALIKPAPAGLVTLLWALSNDGKDKPGFGDVVNALATGRTSIVIDPAFDKSFYRLAGYRNLGRRAVRVDILERLADLIRPASSWREGVGQRPDAAFGSGAFIVTPPMMSILGATSEDMEEILKGLGYRGEPKPAAEVDAKLATLDEAHRAAEAAKALAAEQAAEAAPSEAEPAGTPSGEVPPDTKAGLARPEASQPVTADEPAPVDVTRAAETPAVAEAPVEEAPAQAAEAQPEAAPAEERPPVIVWRQGRSEGRLHGRPQGRRDNAPREGQPRGQQQHGRGQNRGERQGGQAGSGDERREGGRERFERKFKDRPGRHDGGGNRRHDREAEQRSEQKRHKPREERPAKIDPDSPFAKLAALRDQLRK